MFTMTPQCSKRFNIINTTESTIRKKLPQKEKHRSFVISTDCGWSITVYCIETLTKA